MSATLAGSLGVVAPHLPVTLVSDSAYDRVRAVASMLPAPLSSWIYLERALGCDDADDAVDLIVNVDARAGAVLAGRNAAATIDPSLSSHPVWKRVRDFAVEWLDECSALHADVPELWLEFDLDAGHSPADVPVPSVFVDFSADVYRGSPRRRVDAAIRALDVLAGGQLAAGTVDTLRRCIEQLPPHGLPLYAGSMLARAKCGVRLCIMGLNPAELSAYLGAIGWRGARDELQRLTCELARLDGEAHERPAIAHLDIASDLLLRIGLEYTFAREPQASGKIAEVKLLDFLVARGLTKPGERAGLLEWPASGVATMPHELWPSAITRRVNHVKLVFDGDGRLSAKAYLCFGHEYARASKR